MSKVSGNSSGAANHSDIDYTEDAVPVRKLYISNFPVSTSKEDLKAVFLIHGEIEEVQIVTKANTPKAFAFVTFKTPKSAKIARKKVTYIKGKKLIVRSADSWHQPDLDAAPPVANPSEPEAEIQLDQSLLILNDDCLLNVFSYLSLKDLLKVEKVCLRFKSLMEFIYKSYKEFNLSKVDGNLTMMNVKDILSNVGPFATHFEANSTTFNFRNDLLLAMVGRYCTNLTSLTLDSFKITYSIRNLYILFRNLKKLNMQKCQITDKDLTLLLKASDNKLEEINLSYIYGITGSCFNYFNDLKVVNIGNCANVQPKHFISFITHNKNIEDLNIIRCNRINSLCITAIAKELTQLKKLRICNTYDNMESNSCYLALADLPNLIFLQVSFADYMPVDGLLLKLAEKNQLEYLDISNAHMTKNTAKALQGLKSLKTLKINYKMDFDDETLRKIYDLKQLEELELVGCIGITNEGIIDLIKGCKKIRKLDLSGCLGITNCFVLDVMKMIEGRPQVLKVFVGGTQIEETVYTDNHLNPCQYLKLDFENTTESYYPDIDDDSFSDSDDSDEEEYDDDIFENYGGYSYSGDSDCDFDFDDFDEERFFLFTEFQRWGV